MNEQSFKIAKAKTPHSTVAKFIFRQRALLLFFTGILTISTLYQDVNGILLPAKLGYILTGMGAALLAAGLFVRLWASLYIVHNRNKNLVCSGPYGIVRNPLYVGNFVAVVGALTMTGSAYATLAAFAGMAFVYYFTIQYEDERLEQFFGQQFVEFRCRVPRVLPSIHALKALIVDQDFDKISYNNVGKELARAFQALAIVVLLLAFTYTVRHGLM
ncbi:MAG: isoprenylcysteine carboxylmethyltransferase family protein [Pseudomonadales bacterium]|nr:isoprenylcysteine carboxylmethyltransferase family protein [Pseudomonadales bacterium]MCP5192753.1 isoprenylcysteine carboxylmethyltransferase family protein [Pseudomonadales bacterium]